MQTEAAHAKPSTAIQTDLAAIFISLELSRSIWLITSLSPGSGEKLSKCHVVRNGATEAVLDLRCWKWRDQKGLESRICCKYENVGWASASSLIFTASNRMLSLPLQAF